MKNETLRPGDLSIATEPTCLDTILGSCISVCIYDARMKIGGMNHFMLPDPESNAAAYGKNSNKYGTNAIRNLLKGMKRAGSELDDLEAKVLGGANVGDSPSGSLSADVGRLNTKIAMQTLRQFGVKIVAQDTGGVQGRKVQFNTANGGVRFMKMAQPKIANPSVAPKSRVESDTGSGRIRVLIVDDSKPIRLLLRKMLEANRGIEVVGEAVDPIEAMEIRKRTKVDVMTLDLVMPRMDGNTYIKQFMRTDPLPTIVVTNCSIDESNRVMDALESGAFDYLGKPSFDGHEAYAAELFAKIDAAYASRHHLRAAANSSTGRVSISCSKETIDSGLLVIGASTGGTEALREILTHLPSNIPATLIVQHMPAIFSKAFADRLAKLCAFPVHEATHGEEIKAGHVYIAPGGKQMKVQEGQQGLRILVTDDPPVNKFRPSVDYLFDSVCNLRDKNRLKKTLALLLTGMGNDGAKGLATLHERGVSTLAQDEESCVVFGMPKEAIKLRAVDQVVPLTSMAGKIAEYFNKLDVSRFRQAS